MCRREASPLDQLEQAGERGNGASQQPTECDRPGCPTGRQQERGERRRRSNRLDETCEREHLPGPFARQWEQAKSKRNDHQWRQQEQEIDERELPEKYRKWRGHAGACNRLTSWRINHPASNE